MVETACPHWRWLPTPVCELGRTVPTAGGHEAGVPHARCREAGHGEPGARTTGSMRGLSDRELSGPHAEDEDGGQSPTLSSGLAGTRAPRGLTRPCHTTRFQDTV